MFIDFDFYINNGGHDIEESYFNSFNFRAYIKINYYTQNRIIDVTDTVKYLTVLIINLIVDNQSGIIESYSNDGVSVSMKLDRTLEQEIEFAVRQYLPEYSYLGVD